MSSPIRRICTSAFALTMALSLSGGHLMLLQVTAWTGMVLTRTMESGVEDALTTTFDGEHPCSLCEAIKSAQDEQQGKTTPASFNKHGTLKLEATLARGNGECSPSFVIVELVWWDTTPTPEARHHRPLLPPPRSAA